MGYVPNIYHCWHTNYLIQPSSHDGGFYRRTIIFVFGRQLSILGCSQKYISAPNQYPIPSQNPNQNQNPKRNQNRKKRRLPTLCKAPLRKPFNTRKVLGKKSGGYTLKPKWNAAEPKRKNSRIVPKPERNAVRPKRRNTSAGSGQKRAHCQRPHKEKIGVYFALCHSHRLASTGAVSGLPLV